MKDARGPAPDAVVAAGRPDAVVAGEGGEAGAELVEAGPAVGGAAPLRLGPQGELVTAGGGVAGHQVREVRFASWLASARHRQHAGHRHVDLSNTN